MADERYRKLLGIDPAGEIPTHYELLSIDRAVAENLLVEDAYKSQMKKLQAVKTSKDKGFLEYLKEELRTARSTLTNPERRKAYDESLQADSIGEFKKFAQPLMALGLVPKGVVDTIVNTGKAKGLSHETAMRILEEMAKASGATLQLEAPPPPPASASASGRMQAIPDPIQDEPAAFDDGQEPTYTDEYTGHAVSTDGYEGAGPDDLDDSEPAFSDDLDGPPPGEVVLAPPRSITDTGRRGVTPPPPPPPPSPPVGAPAGGSDLSSKIKRGSFWDAEQFTPGSASPPAAEKPASPWSRGAQRGGSPWGRGSSSDMGAVDPGASRQPTPPPGGRTPPPVGESTQSQRDRWQTQESSRALGDARRLFNREGVKNAKIAAELHERLQLYFPPTNGKSSITNSINGISYDKVFDSEQKTYRDAQKGFEGALGKLGGLNGPDSEVVRTRAQQNIDIVKGYLEESRQLRMKLMGGLSKSEELRLWQAFVTSKRSARLVQPIEEK